MKDNNANAPKTRSGDTINPVVGGIIKISAMVVIAALIVLIVIVTVRLVQNKNDAKDLFSENRIVLTTSEFKTLTDPSKGIEDQKADIRAILDENPGEDIYFFFYYSNLRKETLKTKKAEIDRLNELDKNVPVFIVDLYEPETQESQGNTVIDALLRDEKLVELEIATVLNATVVDSKGNTNKKYLTFMLSLNFYEKDEDQPYTLYNRDEGEFNVLTLLKSL